jgi:hypothetical protein
VVDEFTTVAEYIKPDASQLKIDDMLTKDKKWLSEHVRTSKYMSQIAKCLDSTCCSSPRSSFFVLNPSRFIPPPIPLIQTSDGLKAPERTYKENHVFPSLFVSKMLQIEEILPWSTKAFKELPYDLYCLSIQSVLLERICKKCNLYFASKVMLKKHQKVHKNDAVREALTIARTRPVRIAAVRQREMMAIIAICERRKRRAS